jgi:hypothetical protein
MKGISRIVLAAALVPMLYVGPALAGKVLYTAPAQADFNNNDTMYCTIANIDKKTVTVTIEALDYGGAVVDQDTATLETGSGIGLPSTTGARCKFAVSTSTKKVRAMAIYEDLNTGLYTVTVPAQ